MRTDAKLMAAKGDPELVNAILDARATNWMGLWMWLVLKGLSG